ARVRIARVYRPWDGGTAAHPQSTPPGPTSASVVRLYHAGSVVRTNPQHSAAFRSDPHHSAVIRTIPRHIFFREPETLRFFVLVLQEARFFQRWKRKSSKLPVNVG